MQPYSFTADGIADPIIIPKDLAEFLIQRQAAADEDNKEFERLQNAERHLKELMAIIDSHEIDLHDCDRREHLHCDCLFRKMQEIKKTYGATQKSLEPWPAKHL